MESKAEPIAKMLERIASDICDKYCKFPDLYYNDSDCEDEQTKRLIEEHCNTCPLCQLCQFLT